MRALSCLLVPFILAGCSDPVRPVVTTDVGAVVDATPDAPSPDVPATDRAAATDLPVVAVDAPLDAAVEAAVDAPADLGTDVPMDLGRDVPADVPGAAMEAGTDAGLTDAPDVVVLDDGGLGVWFPLGDGACGARARRVVALPGSHVDPDAGPIEWLTNPPSSGNHFGSWARWGAWPDLARGNWVHNLEHGGVAFLYRCTTAPCAATRDALLTVMNGLPPDPACVPDDAAPTRVRVVITNDNVITTPVAASAWGAVYEASCVDAASLRLFYTMFAGHAPEDLCADGSVP